MTDARFSFAGLSASRAQRALFEHALTLLVRQHGATGAQAEAAARELASWRAQSPAHETACLAAQAAWARTDASALRESFDLPPAALACGQHTRRQFTKLLGLGGLVLVAGGVGRWWWLQPEFSVLASTGQGQVESRTLPDGSRIHLAARSALRIAHYRDRRQAELLAGEARFDVTPDPRRPFEVSSRHGRVRVLGTSFSVRVFDDGLRVAVASGRVAVWRGGQTDDAPADAELGTGDAVCVTSVGELRRSRVAPDEVGAWRHGWLVFDGAPLDQAVQRWNDYLAQPLAIERDPALAEMRLTGSFPIDQPAAFLAALPRIHPVEIVALGERGVLIRRQQGRSDEK